MESAIDQAPAESQESSTPKPVNFNFHGKAGEFFKIWVVNVVLSILTLGIYSAWAKVRTNRYFYSLTELDGHRFSYLAKPLQILKGRIIAVVLFGGFYALNIFAPVAGLFASLAFLFIMPFLICASIRFNMRMTSYRNVRFDFKGKAWDAAVNFILLPFASVFTLYLLMPWVMKRIDKFIVDNTRYGNKAFNADTSAGTYYMATFATIGLSIGLLIFLGVIFALFGTSMDLKNLEGEQGASAMFTIVMMGFYLIFFTFVQALYKSIVRNYLFDNTELEAVATFGSTFQFGSLAWLQITNILALICTLGLAFPWTKVRKANYTVDRTQVNIQENIDPIIDSIIEESSAIGDEVANVFDVDVALT
ncbi:YjgN family protein [Thalassotalea litorea]|uniref:YjgN family protein n=1 Tax=Thalassotalea litorea TaxID=2020715 RepID=UPI003736B11E